MIRLLLLTLTMLFTFSAPMAADGNDVVIADISWNEAASIVLQIDSPDDDEPTYVSTTSDAFQFHKPTPLTSLQDQGASHTHWRPQASRAPPAI